MSILCKEEGCAAHAGTTYGQDVIAWCNSYAAQMREHADAALTLADQHSEWRLLAAQANRAARIADDMAALMRELCDDADPATVFAIVSETTLTAVKPRTAEAATLVIWARHYRRPT